MTTTRSGSSANSYDAFNWDAGPPAHREYIQRLRKYMKEEHPSSWPITGYMGMQILTAAIQKANSTESDKVAKAMLNLTVDTPIGKQTIRSQGPAGQSRAVLGQDDQGSEVSFRGDEPADLRRPGAVHGLMTHAGRTTEDQGPSPMRSRASPRCSTSSSTLGLRARR